MHMKKLEDIPKTDIFKVPEGYFDSLPSIVQARVAKKESGWMPALQLSLKYALPVLVIAVGAFWFLNNESATTNTEQLLASISSDDLIEYIQDAEMNTEDLLESIDYTQMNADSLNLYEADVPISDDDLSDVLTEFETEL